MRDHKKLRLPFAASVTSAILVVTLVFPYAVLLGDDTLGHDYGSELPRISPTEPAEALSTFAIHPDFCLQQVAAEPLVADPVALSFDEQGRLYIVEMRGYSEESEKHLGRIRLLEDTDGDGIFDASTVFLDGLSWPTALICYGGGVYVGAAPDILYCKDTDGDKRCDTKRAVFAGFGRGNVQGLFNSFRWGLDNHIHGAASSAGAVVRRTDAPDEEPLVLRGRDFCFDPRTLEIKPTSGGGQHGVSFDDWGRKYVSSNSDHIQLVMYEDHYIARNPFLLAPSPRRSIALDGPQAEVFRTSPVEPWRIVRTRLRVAGTVPGPIEGGGRPAGYFTGATGITIFRGDAWPDEYRGQAFVGDVGSNIVHRKLLTDRGITITADRADDGREFLTSSDIWFRPVQFANAPDGNLYIADFYREVIEHPDSLPPVIKQHLDLNSGNDRGRIYRIAPRDFSHPRVPDLSDLTGQELVLMLSHKNAWHRETAARLIYERNDPTLVPLLCRLFEESPAPLGRLHALHAMAGLNGLAEKIILAGLNDTHPGVRRHAVLLAESLVDSSTSVREFLLRMTEDRDSMVRYQLAFTLGEMEDRRKVDALAELVARDPASEWMALAVQSSCGNIALDVLVKVIGEAANDGTNGAPVILSSLARQAAAHSQLDQLQSLASPLEQMLRRSTSEAIPVFLGLDEGFRQRGMSLHSWFGDVAGLSGQDSIEKLVDQSQQTSLDRTAKLEAREQAIAALALVNWQSAEHNLEVLLAANEPHEIQLAGLRVMARFTDSSIADIILDAWPSMTPSVRRQAEEVLFSRDVFSSRVLAALEQGLITPLELSPDRQQALYNHREKDVQRRARRLFDAVVRPDRSQVLEEYRAALAMEGDIERGKQVFNRVCAACHRVGELGREIGPNLIVQLQRGDEQFLQGVLDPSREVTPQYLNYVLVTVDGRTVTGMLDAETAASVTLVRGEGQRDTVARAEIESLRGTGVSLMPENLEREISVSQMADLLAFLRASS